MLREFLAEYQRWKHRGGDPLEFRVDDDGVYWLLVDERVQRLNVSVLALRDPHDEQAVLVESPLGLWENLDGEALLRFAGEELFVSRLSLVGRAVMVESAMPLSALTLPLFDRMVREVASVAMVWTEAQRAG